MENLDEALSIMWRGLLVVFAVMLLIAVVTWISGRIFVSLDKKRQEKEKAEEERKQREKEEKKKARQQKKAEEAAKKAALAQETAVGEKPADPTPSTATEQEKPKDETTQGGE